ncbi:MAG: hypothetical protein ACKOUM_00120 [Sphingopyxis sp.]
MAIIRMFRSEAVRLMLMGFLFGAAGLALTQPGEAQAGTKPAAQAGINPAAPAAHTTR